MSLSFLTVWQLQGRRTSSMEVHSGKTQCPKEQGGTLIAFLLWTSEVLLYCHSFLYLSKQSQAWPDSKGGDRDQSSGSEERQNVFSPVLKPPTLREKCSLSPLPWIQFLRPISKVSQLLFKFISLYKGFPPPFPGILNLTWYHWPFWQSSEALELF